MDRIFGFEHSIVEIALYRLNFMPWVRCLPTGSKAASLINFFNQSVRDPRINPKTRGTAHFMIHIIVFRSEKCNTVYINLGPYCYEFLLFSGIDSPTCDVGA